jgi:hypothetical protein
VKRRKWLIVVGLILLVGGFAAAWLLWPWGRTPPPPGYDAIVAGMTTNEVRALLGMAPQQYGVADGRFHEWYYLDRGMVDVTFASVGKQVIAKDFQPRPSPSILDQLWAWIGSYGRPATMPVAPVFTQAKK